MASWDHENLKSFSFSRGGDGPSQEESGAAKALREEQNRQRLAQIERDSKNNKEAELKALDMKAISDETVSMILNSNDPKAGRKFDQGKTRWGLMFGMKSMHAVAEVLTYGAVKYAAYNYRYVKGWRWRYVDAALRHLFAYMTGEKTDKESGFHHLAHFICCGLMLLDNELLNMPNGDDEPEKEKL